MCGTESAPFGLRSRSFARDQGLRDRGARRKFSGEEGGGCAVELFELYFALQGKNAEYLLRGNAGPLFRGVYRVAAPHCEWFASEQLGLLELKFPLGEPHLPVVQ